VGTPPGAAGGVWDRSVSVCHNVCGIYRVTGGTTGHSRLPRELMRPQTEQVSCWVRSGPHVH
jgi:hypothetical protein